MTATLIAFPTLQERDDMEFERCGTSSYTRAIEEAAALLKAAWSMPDRAPLTSRAEGLARSIGRLALGRPEKVGDFVVLDDGSRIELRAVPPMLAAMLA